jgi:hypothetical protein
MRRSIILVTLMLCGCPPDFDPASHVEGLRVLAIKSEPPELAPGQTATLTPLVVATRGMDAGEPRITWSLCLRPPLPGSAVANECLSTDGGEGLTPLGEGPTMQVTMPELPPDALGIPDFTGGVYLPVVMRVTDGVETVTAVYRLRRTLLVSTPVFTGPVQPVNNNPRIDDILITYEHDAGMRPFDTYAIHAGDRVMLRPVLPKESYEQYPQIEGTLEIPDGGVSLDGGVRFFDGGLEVGGIRLINVTENLRVSWFSSIGSFDPDVTGAAGKEDASFRLDKFVPAPPADIDLYIVVRDDRGGIDFTTRKLLLR